MGPLERFSTAAVEPHQRVAYWNEMTNASFVPLVSEPADASSFQARMVRARIGEVTFSEIHSQPQTLRHLRSHVARSRMPLFFVNVQLGGRSINRQDGRAACLQAGDFTLCDTTRPYEQTLEGASHRLIVAVPAAFMRRHVETPEALVALPMSGQTGTGQLLSRLLQDFWRQRLASRDGLGEHEATAAILHLLASAYAGTARTRLQEIGIAAAHRMRIRSYVEAHLGDPELTPARIAAACRMTPRYLHYLYSEEPETIGRYVLRRRLEESALALRDSAQGSRSVTAIAFDHGFNSPTHFGRVFRARHGMTPREYRQQGATQADETPAA